MKFPPPEPTTTMNPSIRLLIATSFVISPLAVAQERETREPVRERPNAERPTRPVPAERQAMARQMEAVQGMMREQAARMERALRERDEALAGMVREMDARLKRLEGAAKPEQARTETKPHGDHDKHAERVRKAMVDLEVKARAMKEQERAMDEKLQRQQAEMAEMTRELRNRNEQLRTQEAMLAERAKQLNALEARLREAEKGSRKERGEAE